MRVKYENKIKCLLNKHSKKMKDDERKLKERTLWQKFTGYIPDDIEAW